MIIPQGNWCVVQRKLTDSTSSGIIIKSGLTEKQAKKMVNDCRSHQSLLNLTKFEKYDYWTIHMDDLKCF